MIKDKLWIWGQSAGSHHAAGNNGFRLPGVNRMGPVEGAAYLGIENMCLVVMGNDPLPPFDPVADTLTGFKKVAWSIIGDSGSSRTSDGITDLDEVLRLAAKYPNMVGGIMDDFMSPERMAAFPPSVLKGFADKLHAADMELWTVIYEYELNENAREYLDQCDIISFWTWNANNLHDADANLKKLRGLLAPEKKIYAGCYMWDYGGKQPMSVENMAYQLDLYKNWLTEGRVDGIIFCSNCIADLGLDAVEYTRKWISENS